MNLIQARLDILARWQSLAPAIYCWIRIHEDSLMWGVSRSEGFSHAKRWGVNFDSAFFWKYHNILLRIVSTFYCPPIKRESEGGLWGLKQVGGLCYFFHDGFSFHWPVGLEENISVGTGTSSQSYKGRGPFFFIKQYSPTNICQWCGSLGRDEWILRSLPFRSKWQSWGGTWGRVSMLCEEGKKERRRVQKQWVGGFLLDGRGELEFTVRMKDYNEQAAAGEVKLV